MGTAAIAAEAGLADVSDAALVKRFAKAGDWLATLVSDLLVDVEPTLPRAARLRVLAAKRGQGVQESPALATPGRAAQPNPVGLTRPPACLGRRVGARNNVPPPTPRETAAHHSVVAAERRIVPRERIVKGRVFALEPLTIRPRGTC
jgi:hypothetical protein